MLIFINEAGPRKAINSDDVGSAIIKLGSNYQPLLDYLNSKIDTLDSFSVATHFGGEWGDRPALECLWLALLDHDLCKYVLGIIVHNIIVDRTECWHGIKSDLLKREHEINFYWRRTPLANTLLT